MIKMKTNNSIFTEKIDEITNENNLEQIKLTRDIVDLYISKLQIKD